MAKEINVLDDSTTEAPTFPIAGDKTAKAMYVAQWYYNSETEKWQRGVLTNVDELFQRDLLEQVLVELKILNLHMATLSDNVIKEEDIT